MRDDYTSEWGYRLKWAYLFTIVGALLMPVFYVIVISFNEHGFAARIYEFTTDWYRVVLGEGSQHTQLVGDPLGDHKASHRWTTHDLDAAICHPPRKEAS